MAEATYLRNNALPYPVYGAPWTVVFPIFNSTGALIADAAGLDSEISKNGDSLTDCTNESVEIETNGGIYYLSLTGTELTTDVASIIVKSTTSKALTTPIVLYPRKLVTLASGTSQGGDTGYITLAAATVGFSGQYNGCLCVATIDGNLEARILQVCTASNQQCTVTPAWNVAPDADDTYVIYLPEGMQIPTANTTHVSGTAQTAGDLYAAVTNIANVGSPSYAAPSSYTLTTGNQTSGTFANVDSDNDIYHVHTDAAGTLSLLYDWTLTADEQGNSIIWRGRWNGNNDTLLFELYDWVGPGWVTWFTQVGVTGTTSAADFTKETSLVAKYTGTGANVGKLRCRITGSGLSSCTLSTDQLIVGKTSRSGGITNGSTVTLAATTNNANYTGNNWILDLGGQDISGCYFYGAKQVTGTSSASTGVTFENCDFGAATVPPGKFINCGFGLASGTLTAASAGEYILRSCYSCVPGSGTPVFDWATGTGTIRINGRGWHGGSSHTIDGDNTISWEVNGGGGQTFAGGGTVELRGNFRQATFTGHAADKTSQIVSSGCGPIAINGSGGTVNIFGLTGTITDNSAAAVTITSTQVVNLANVNAEVDTALGAGVNMVQISGDTTAADRLEALLDATPTGAVVDENDPDPTTLLFETNLTEASNDHYNGAFVVFFSGALLGQSRKISDYDGTNKIITVATAFTEAPGAGDTFMILGRSE